MKRSSFTKQNGLKFAAALIVSFALSMVVPIWPVTAWAVDEIGNKVLRRGPDVQPLQTKASDEPGGVSKIPELVVQSGHSDEIRSLVFSPDGKMLASASADGTVRLWNVAQERLVRTIDVSQYWVHSMAFSPDGASLATGSGDNLVQTWDVRTGRRKMSIQGHAHAVTALAFSLDGSMLASGSGVCGNASDIATIILWDLRSGKKVGELPVGRGNVIGLMFLDDNTLISIADGQESVIAMWDVRNRRLTRAIKEPIGIMRSLRLAMNKKNVALLGTFVESQVAKVSTLSSGVRVWELPSGRQKQSFDVRTLGIHDIALLPGQNFLWMVAPQRIYQKDIESGVIQREISGNFGQKIGIAPSGQTIAFVSQGKTIQLLETKQGSIARKLPSASRSVRSMGFSHNGLSLASGMGDGSVSVWDIKHGNCVLSFQGHTEPVHSIGYDKQDESIMTAAIDGHIFLWYPSGGGKKQTLQVPVVGTGDPIESERLASRCEINPLKIPSAPRHFQIGEDIHPRSVMVSGFSPTMEEVVYGGFDNFVSIWDFRNGKNYDIYRDEKNKAGVSAIAFSLNGDSLAFGDEAGRIILSSFPPETKVIKMEINLHMQKVNALVFSPGDARYLASASSDRSIIVWDIITGNLAHITEGHKAPVLALAFSATGSHLATGGADNKINIWKMPSLEHIRSLEGHSSAINVLAHAPDKQLLVSGSEDGTMMVWNSKTYKHLATAASLGEGAWIVFTPDGFFDGPRRAWQMVPFRFPSEPLRLYEPEQFFNQFYQPGLLAEIFREEKPIREILKNRKDPRANLDISAYRNSTLPEVKIVNPEDGFKTKQREIQVTLEVKDTGSGIRDLRVFRNQTLVHFEHGDLKPDTQIKTYRLTVPVKMVAGPNEISAYAFNRDNLKSKDSTINVTGADTLRRKGTAYVLAVGVNQYSNTDWNLNYAVNDAKGISEMLEQSFNKLKTYAQTVPVTLLNGAASRANLLTAFGLLSGAITSLPAGAPEVLKKLRQAEPEDDIIVYFSGHGMADQDRYYLIPHDMGYQGRRANLSKEARREIIMKHSLSDQDLNTGFEKIDAGRMMLIIDACQSGQALESEEKRRGPMNSRGLAQLAYEKGMYILAAAQSFQAALEFERLGHGLLTYVLIEEGLKRFAADTNPKDNQITAEEWLDYATQRAGREVEGARIQYAKKKGGEQIDGGEVTVTGQSPRAYYRRERVGDPWVIGR